MCRKLGIELIFIMLPVGQPNSIMTFVSLINGLRDRNTALDETRQVELGCCLLLGARHEIARLHVSQMRFSVFMRIMEMEGLQRNLRCNKIMGYFG